MRRRQRRDVPDLSLPSARPSKRGGAWGGSKGLNRWPAQPATPLALRAQKGDELKCFLDGCKQPSQFNQGGFCDSHWAMLRQIQQARIRAAIVALRQTRSEALASIQPDSGGTT